MKTIAAARSRRTRSPVSSERAERRSRTPASAARIERRRPARSVPERRRARRRREQQHAEPSWSARPQTTVAPRHARGRSSEQRPRRSPSARTSPDARRRARSPVSLTRCALPRQAASSARGRRLGSGAPATAEITAKPAAPAARTLRRARRRCRLIATTGSGARGAPPRPQRASPRVAPLAIAFELVCRTPGRSADVVDRPRCAAATPARAVRGAAEQQPRARRRAESGPAAGRPGRRWTPSAPHASARSNRSFTQNSALARCVSARISAAQRERGAGRSRAWRAAARPAAPPAHAARACVDRVVRPARVVVGEHVQTAEYRPAGGVARRPGRAMPSSTIFLRSVLRLMPSSARGADLVAVGARERRLDQRPLDALEHAAGRSAPPAVELGSRLAALETLGEVAATARRRGLARRTRSRRARARRRLPSTSARFTAFSSSRTLPGHAWRRSGSSAASVNERGPPASSCGIARDEVLGEQRARPRAARAAAAMCIGTTRRR